MTGKNAEKPDVARALALLWGTQGKPGRSNLTLRAIVAASIELADAQGLEAVSMRQIADRLKVGTMSLYTHVPGKSELTDLMTDTVYGELYEDVDAPSKQPGWREALMFIAQRNWELLKRHPWLLSISARLVLGPNATLKYEAELRPLDALGLSDVEMDSVLSLVLTHVQGTARLHASLHASRAEMSDQEWWRSMEPTLLKLIDARRFPVASRVGEAAHDHYEGIADPMHALTFGLETILDGVALLIAKRSQKKPKSKPGR